MGTQAAAVHVLISLMIAVRIITLVGKQTLCFCYCDRAPIPSNEQGREEIVTFSDLFLLIYNQIFQVLTMKPSYEIELFVVIMFSQTPFLETNMKNMAKREFGLLHKVYC